MSQLVHLLLHDRVDRTVAVLLLLERLGRAQNLPRQRTRREDDARRPQMASMVSDTLLSRSIVSIRELCDSIC